MTTTFKPVSLRRAKSRFRFDASSAKPSLSAWVFTTSSPLLRPSQDAVGVFGAPVVTLDGFKAVRTPQGNNSVVQAGDFVLGRAVELSAEEIARLDDVAEQIGDYHRFLTPVTLTSNGHKLLAWVYQARKDAGFFELAHSADKLTDSAISPADLINV